MEHGIGLPTTVSGVAGRDLIEWASRAEEAGFTTLGVLDRLVYGNHEPVVALAAAAAATSRIRLATTILIAAYRANLPLLAKQLATLDQVSGGRLVVGVAAGGRVDDFAWSGVPYHRRGRLLDSLIQQLPKIWSGESGVGPLPLNDPPLLVGGHSPAALRRAARYGHGWIMGGSSVTPPAALIAQFRDLWRAHGRTGPPRIVALAYYALGPRALERAQAHLRAYYAPADGYAERVAASVLTHSRAIQDATARYADAGCDELLFFPCVGGADQLDRLVDGLGE
jgi:alkanesulfonate monooxygenase SsuD/methylene tetrahydromethanopterin reductase-like flavin-dependent oxidoreductase (luciferase family)